MHRPIPSSAGARIRPAGPHARRRARRAALRLSLLAALGAGVGLLLAADAFVPAEAPYGYVAPPVASSGNIGGGGEKVFIPYFETTTFGGDLLAFTVASTGRIESAPAWKASEQLPLPDQRRIFTTNGAGLPVPLRTTPAPAGLTPTQLATFWDPGVVNWLRGSRTGEGSSYRSRGSLIGDIIHANPVHVGKARAGYPFDGYPAFAYANRARPGRVYVAANDGMVHAFDAATGAEAFAFVPTALLGTVDEPARPGYVHRYLADGPLVSDDACISRGGSGRQWRTLLVGGLGGGGQSVFALDVTSAAPISGEDNSASGAGSRYLWEFSSSSPGGGNLGYTYGRSSIVQLNDGRWAVVVGNGYLSAGGRASLYVLDAGTGSVIRELVVNATYGGTANGLSSPALIDVNGDYKVDYAYAGDLNGNVWKFDLSSTNPSAWSLAFGGASGRPLFQTHEGVPGKRQPITSAPDVGLHPSGGVIVYAGTGRLLAAADSIDLTTQYVYGLWDKPGASATSHPILASELAAQTLYGAEHESGARVRLASNAQPNWATQRGWALPLRIDGAGSGDLGERVLQDVLLRDGRVQLTVNNPAIAKGENWLLQVDALTGGAPARTVLDVDNNLSLTIADNVDRNDGAVEDVPEDRAVAVYAGYGLVSRPLVVSVGSGGDTSIVNFLYIVPPVPPPPVDPEDPGVLGGHFDLDTSSMFYALNAGTTDAHVHEWDDKTGLTTIDFGADGTPIPGSAAFHELTQNLSPTKKFYVIVGNAPFSWDGVLSINGTPTPVAEYDVIQRDFFANGAAATRKLTRYALHPTPAELAAGVVKLTDLELSFTPYAILKGGIIPTQTGCVRKNRPGSQGEYRNGALIVQVIDADAVGAGFRWDTATKTFSYPASGTTSSAIKVDVGPGRNVVYATRGLLWEASVFWHWKGPCYANLGYEVGYKSATSFAFASLVGADGSATKGRQAASGDGSGGTGPGGTGSGGSAGTAQQTIVTQRQAGARRMGRLFWHEEILDR